MIISLNFAFKEDTQLFLYVTFYMLHITNHEGFYRMIVQPNLYYKSKLDTHFSIGLLLAGMIYGVL